MRTRKRRKRRALARRRFPRWRVSGVRLAGPLVKASVLDLGPAGAGIETANALRIGAPYAFTLELGEASRRLRGRVRWCRLVALQPTSPGELTPVYRAGLSWSPRHLPRPDPRDR